MKRSVRINLILFFFAIILTACSRGYDIDSNGNPITQAVEIVESRNPKEAAKDVIEWMTNAGIENREFARGLTKEILSHYDSIDSNYGRVFLYALDSLKEKLSDKKLARVYVMTSSPRRLGVTLRDADASDALVEAVKAEYMPDSVSLDYFIRSYYNER